MEQPVWIIFGVISIIITIGIISKVVYDHNQSNHEEYAKLAIDALQAQCKLVCSTTPGNKLSIPIIMPYNMTIYTTTDKICGIYDGRTTCARCPCTVSPYTFTTDNEFAKSMQTLNYECYITRQKSNVSIQCQG
jgi:hypothetical protein